VSMIVQGMLGNCISLVACKGKDMLNKRKEGEISTNLGVSRMEVGVVIPADREWGD